jgi:enamine deaminase RidA (YjgF/YER057c/UK114 family)
MKRVLQPAGWAARGTQVYVAGQIGWNAQAQFESDDFIDQVRQALRNVQAVLESAGARPEHLVRMTWYVLDRAEYVARARELGAVYREVLGRHYDIAMTAVQVGALMEPRARVEIEATAVVPD